MAGYLITIGASTALPAEEDRRCRYLYLYRHRKADAGGTPEGTRLGTSTKGLLVLSHDCLACELFHSEVGWLVAVCSSLWDSASETPFHASTREVCGQPGSLRKPLWQKTPSCCHRTQPINCMVIANAQVDRGRQNIWKPM